MQLQLQTAVVTGSICSVDVPDLKSIMVRTEELESNTAEAARPMYVSDDLDQSSRVLLISHMKTIQLF